METETETGLPRWVLAESSRYPGYFRVFRTRFVSLIVLEPSGRNTAAFSNSPEAEKGLPRWTGVWLCASARRDEPPVRGEVLGIFPQRSTFKMANGSLTGE